MRTSIPLLLLLFCGFSQCSPGCTSIYQSRPCMESPHNCYWNPFHVVYKCYPLPQQCSDRTSAGECTAPSAAQSSCQWNLQSRTCLSKVSLTIYTRRDIDFNQTQYPPPPPTLILASSDTQKWDSDLCVSIVVSLTVFLCVLIVVISVEYDRGTSVPLYVNRRANTN